MKSSVLTKKEPDTAPQTAAEYRAASMRRLIRRLTLFLMLLMPLLVSYVLQGVSVYVDTDLSVMYPSTAMTVFQWGLYYLILILNTVYQHAAFGVTGYSILRFGIKRSAFPIFFSFISMTLSYIANIVEIFYLYGSTAILENTSYYIFYWVLNYVLSLFSNFCILFLCAMLRVSFAHKNRQQRLQVGIEEEPRQVRRKNPLRRLYLWMTLLMLLFNFVPGVFNTISEISSVGGPENGWEWYSLLEPYLQMFLLCALGYFVKLHIGGYLTGRDKKYAAAYEALQQT